MRYLQVEELIRLHQRVIEVTGGSSGLRDRGALESAVAQPQMTLGSQDLYPTLEENAAALGFSLIGNHPFVDGNKRTGFVAMDVFLRVHGFRIHAPADQAEEFLLRLAAGELQREALVAWLQEHLNRCG